VSSIDTIIDERLQRWASWAAGGDSAGFPRVNVLHPSWMPPSPGMTPTLRSTRGSGQALATQAAVAALSLKLRNTVVLHYCKRLSLAQHAAELGCAPSTVTARLAQARRQLWRDLGLGSEGDTP